MKQHFVRFTLVTLIGVSLVFPLRLVNSGAVAQHQDASWSESLGRWNM